MPGRIRIYLVKSDTIVCKLFVNSVVDFQNLNFLFEYQTLPTWIHFYSFISTFSIFNNSIYWVPFIFITIFFLSLDIVLFYDRHFAWTTPIILALYQTLAALTLSVGLPAGVTLKLLHSHTVVGRRVLLLALVYHLLTYPPLVVVP